MLLSLSHTYTRTQYNVGQLYMIARHSQEESSNGEGVEVVVNEPCEDDVKGRGQYTEKRIHLNKWDGEGDPKGRKGEREGE